MHNQTLTEITVLSVTQHFVYFLIGTSSRKPCILHEVFEGIITTSTVLWGKRCLCFETNTTPGLKLFFFFIAAFYHNQNGVLVCVVLLVQGVAKKQLQKSQRRASSPRRLIWVSPSQGLSAAMKMGAMGQMSTRHRDRYVTRVPCTRILWHLIILALLLCIVLILWNYISQFLYHT